MILNINDILVLSFKITNNIEVSKRKTVYCVNLNSEIIINFSLQKNSLWCKTYAYYNYSLQYISLNIINMNSINTEYYYNNILKS